MTVHTVRTVIHKYVNRHNMFKIKDTREGTGDSVMMIRYSSEVIQWLKHHVMETTNRYQAYADIVSRFYCYRLVIHVKAVKIIE